MPPPIALAYHDLGATVDLTQMDGAGRAFIAGDWGQALEHLSQLPADDQAAAFLEQFIGKHGGSPPIDWDGEIPLEAK